MTISKKQLKRAPDHSSRARIIFNLSALIFTLILGFLVIYLFPSRANSPEISTNSIAPPATTTKIDNSALEIPVLMYHYIRTVTDPADTMGKSLSVTPITFDKQLAYLEDNGFATIDISQALRLFNNEESISKKPVIITFDDGYADAKTNAMPALIRHNQTGIFYIISAFVKSHGYVSFDDIGALIDNKMTIGCHTLDHLDLTRLDDVHISSELSDCKESLSDLYKIKITGFSYPSGKYNSAVIEQVQVAGYETAVTTKSGIWKADDGVFEIPRIRMTETTNLAKVLNH